MGIMAKRKIKKKGTIATIIDICKRSPKPSALNIPKPKKSMSGRSLTKTEITGNKISIKKLFKKTKGDEGLT